MFILLKESIELKSLERLSEEEHPRTGNSKKYIVGVCEINLL
jgi:hypothetical protein